MKITQAFGPQLLRLFLIACMVTLGACGSDDDDGDTNVVVNTPTTPELQQEQEGAVDTSPTIIVNNRIENNVRVINRRTRVERRNYHFDWECRNVAPVVHKQLVYISVRCPTIAEDDRNDDKFLDQVEVEQAVGQSVLALGTNLQTGGQPQFPSGPSYTYTRSLPLGQLRQSVPQGQDFIVIIYGADPSESVPETFARTTDEPVHLTVPIACKVFKAPELVSTDTTTGGTTDGTTTDGTTDEVTNGTPGQP